MSITQGLKKYIEERSRKIEKYVSKPLQATVTLKVEKYRQIAEAHVNLNGVVLQAEEETDEMEASVDKVMSKIEKQLRKYKEKASNHRVRIAGPEAMGRSVSMPKGPEDPPFIALGKDVFRIPKREKISVNVMTIEEALLQMKSNKKEFFCFRNSANRQLNLLYKKKSGILGLMELID
ncbi:MAG: ribosome-associated translation inhibitor RaiA [Nitrospirae bacterium]|nr:ribosome-associated translation inhibitor RaiA [Candidatus Troglogloeales bacterium]